MAGGVGVRYLRGTMHRPFPRFALLAALAAAVSLPAQTELSFTSGETKTAPVVLTGANTPFTFRVDTGTATQSGSISESGGSYDIWKDGAGTLVLGTANTYTGNTLIANGTLETGTSGALSTGLVYLGGYGALHLTGDSHTVSGLIFNANTDPNGTVPFLVVSGGAQLTTIGWFTTYFEDPATAGGIVVSGSGSRITTPRLDGDLMKATLSDGGVLELTDSGATPRFHTLNIGAAAGETATGAGHLVTPGAGGFISVDTLQFNHTATDYWFTSDGTSTGSSMPVFGSYVISAGTTIFKNTADTGGILTINGGEARFSAPVQGQFVTMTINAGGTGSFAANPFRTSSYEYYLNGGTFHATESFTLLVNQTDHLFHATSGTFTVDAGKTLTLATEHDPITNAYGRKGQAINGTGSFVKSGAGTLVVERDYVEVDLGVPDFTVRQGTLRTPSYVFDEVVIGKLAGDNGTATVAPVNVQQWGAGVPLSLGFFYANYWTPTIYGPPLLGEFDASGMTASTQYLVPAAQSRSLTLGEQAGATGNLTLNEGAAGGWYVDNGLVIVGGAGTGNVTLTGGHFLYNNGHDIVLGQSAGGVGNVTVSGANAQLNAGVDLTPLDMFSYSGQGDTPAIDRGAGNIIIGQGGTGHVTVTNHAQILAAQTFIGNGSDLTLGSGGMIYGGFTAQNGSTLHALDDATFAFTLGSATEASLFEAGSTFLVDASADLIFAITQGAGFGLGTYTLFTFDPAATLTGLDDANFSATGLNGYSYAFDLTASGLNLTVSAIPEPSTYAMLVGALALGFVIVRRRKAL